MLDLENGEKETFSGYRTIYGLLIFVFHRVGIPCHAMCCEQIVISNFRNSSRELDSEKQAAAGFAYCLIFGEHQKLLHDFGSANGCDSRDGYPLICGLRAFRIMIQWCYRKRTSLSEALWT